MQLSTPSRRKTNVKKTKTSAAWDSGKSGRASTKTETSMQTQPKNPTAHISTHLGLGEGFQHLSLQLVECRLRPFHPAIQFGPACLVATKTNDVSSDSIAVSKRLRRKNTSCSLFISARAPSTWFPKGYVRTVLVRAQAENKCRCDLVVQHALLHLEVRESSVDGLLKNKSHDRHRPISTSQHKTGPLHDETNLVHARMQTPVYIETKTTPMPTQLNQINPQQKHPERQVRGTILACCCSDMTPSSFFSNACSWAW
eukprot:3754386-Rhodomonas_salina.1